MYPEVVVTSTICSEEVLFSQHLRGLKPETPVSWQLCRQSMSKITLSRGSPGPHLQDDPPQDSSMMLMASSFDLQRRKFFGPRGRAEVSCTATALLPRNKGQDLHLSTMGYSHSFKSSSACGVFLSYIFMTGHSDIVTCPLFFNSFNLFITELPEHSQSFPFMGF